MALIARTKTGESYEPLPVGNYAGVIKDVMMHEQRADGEFKDAAPQVKVVLKIGKVLYAQKNRPTEAFPDPQEPEDHIGREIFAYCNFEPSPKNTAGRWVEAITGQAITPNMDFDWHSLLGTRVTITCGRSRNNGQKITELSAYVPSAREKQARATGDRVVAAAPQTTTLPQPAAAADDPWDAEPFGDDAGELPF